jgi:RNA-binding protein
LAQHEIQSVEVSCFLHATEDEAKVRNAVVNALGVEEGPSEETLEGHFGNPILHLVWHATGDAAWTVFRRLVEFIGESGKKEVLGALEGNTDEHGTLYLRLDKQALVRGTALFSSSEPVRVRVKPRRFMMRGSPEQFYRMLMGPE